MSTIRRMSKSLYGENKFKEPLLSSDELQLSKHIESIYVSVLECCGSEFQSMHILLD